MEYYKAAVYGIIQGLTEFLPISSSAHLALLPWFFGWEDPGLAFDVAMHWGTLVSVVFYFRRDIKNLIAGWVGSFSGKKEPANILPWTIILATIPAAFFGFLLEEKAETVFRSPVLISMTLAGAGILLFWADKKSPQSVTIQESNWKKALIIGIFQIFSIIPGVSRSGITTTGARFLSFTREEAVRFSFLLSIPIIFGAGVLKIDFIFKNLENPAFWVAFLSSAVSGLAAIHFLLTYVKKRSFTPFVIYRVLLAVVILVWLSWSRS